MEGRLLRLERHYQYEKESTVPWQIKNNPDRLGIALSDAQIPANPAYLFTNDMKDPTRAKREHLIDYLSDLLAENRFQAKDGQGGAWTEWRLHAIGGIDEVNSPSNEKVKVIIVRYPRASIRDKTEGQLKAKENEPEGGTGPSEFKEDPVQ